MSDEQAGRDPRLDALEEAVRRLSADVRRLQSAAADAAPPIGRPSEPARPFAPLPPRATTSRGVVSGGLEQAIGRYGTLVVATFAILLGLGAFLQWAVARGLLGPEIRVALGAVGAVVLAALGLRLRGKGNRAFGNALLAIALAMVHLVAWGAGPVLGIIPSTLALGIAAIASVGLASLAIREREELLFVLGLGGALLAPFVTMRGEGGPLQLLVFGGLVLTASIIALREEQWRLAPRLLTPFAFGYIVAAAPMRRMEHGIASVYWPTTFALALALVALAFGARGTRRAMVKEMLLLVAFGVVIVGAEGQLPWTGITYAVLGTLTMHALRRRTRATTEAATRAESDANSAPDTWDEVVGVPLVFMVIALGLDDAWREPVGAAIAIGWTLLTLPFLLLDPATQRARHLTVMLIAAIGTITSILHGHPIGIVPAFAFLATISIYVYHRVPGKALLLPIGLALGFGTLRTIALIDERLRWEYTPFLNQPALVGATMVVAWIVFSFVVPKALAAMDADRKPWGKESQRATLMMLGPIVAFLWIRSELIEAYSRDIATFLLITYYALAGVGTILVGRKREVDGLRQAGLALTLFAAGKAFVAANLLQSIGLRVGSYLIVGVFVLGVGYLYRAAPAEEVSAA